MPVNLRKLYPSKTLRNFVSMMSIAHRGGDTLEKIISECKDQFRAQYNREFFDKLVGYNVWGQHFFLIKIAPLPVKRLALKLLNLKYGDNVRTSTLPTWAESPPRIISKSMSSDMNFHWALRSMKVSTSPA